MTARPVDLLKVRTQTSDVGQASPGLQGIISHVTADWLFMSVQHRFQTMSRSQMIQRKMAAMSNNLTPLQLGMGLGTGGAPPQNFFYLFFRWKWCICTVSLLKVKTRGQSNLTKSASRGAHSPGRGHPRGSKVVPLNSWGRVSY